TYSRDNNVVYPSEITYTGNGTTDGIFAVNFATTTRSDIRVSYTPDFAATTTQLITQITAVINGTTAREYDLSYGTGDNGYRSLLTSVQEKGYDNNGNATTLPAMTFNYATTSTQFLAPAARTVDGAAYVVTDTDADGINDVNLFMGGTANGYLYDDNYSNVTV